MDAKTLEAFTLAASKLGISTQAITDLCDNKTEALAAYLVAVPVPGSGDELDDEFTEQIRTARVVHDEECARTPRRVRVLERDGIVERVKELRDSVIRSPPYGQAWMYVGLPRHSSSRSFEDLQPTSRDMRASKTHKGRYLLCRILTVPILTSGMTMVVEDQDGRVEHLSLYNLDLHGVSNGPDLDTLFPQGAVLVIREPTYQTEPRDTSKFVIRVESPTDYHFLPPQHPLTRAVRWATPAPVKPRPASSDYKALGNGYFAEKKDLLAVKAYSDGLDATDDPALRLVLALNRAIARVRVGAFVSACRDSSDVIALLSDGVSGPPRAVEKAMLRRAKALEGARLLTRACEEYRRITIFEPDNEEAKAARSRIEGMLEASRTGQYDWLHLRSLDLPATWRNGTLNVADFFGPIKVAAIEGRKGGRGIVATRNIKAGELLLVEKAFAFGLDASSKGYDLGTDLVLSASRIGLIAAVVSKIQDDPACAKLVYSLYAGPKFAPLGTTPLGAYQDRDVPFDDAAPVPFADIERIQNIAIYSGVELTQFELVGSPAPTGLWLGGSHFNHDCMPNAAVRHQGDVMIVRARSPIKAGAEVFISHHNQNPGIDRQKALFAAHFPDGCPCDHCRISGGDAAEHLAKVAALVGEGSEWAKVKAELVATDYKDPRVAERALKVYRRDLPKVEAAYPRGHGPIKPDLFRPLQDVAELVPDEEAIQLNIRAFASVGAEFKYSANDIDVVSTPVVYGDMTMSCMMTVAYLHGRLHRHAGEHAWFKAAAKMCHAIEGYDYDAFCKRSVEVVATLGLERLVEACRPVVQL